MRSERPAEGPPNAGHDNRAEAGHDQSAAARFVLALLRAYKLLVSPYFYGSCRFVPSCADYATEAVLRHGALAGGWLAARRIVRCHPLCQGGLDAVPLSRR